jgi:hypothetical protein
MTQHHPVRRHAECIAQQVDHVRRGRAQFEVHGDGRTRRVVCPRGGGHDVPGVAVESVEAPGHRVRALRARRRLASGHGIGEGDDGSGH